jgi:hypothetical protein
MYARDFDLQVFDLSFFPVEATYTIDLPFFIFLAQASLSQMHGHYFLKFAET